jgi:hypothetical protein
VSAVKFIPYTNRLSKLIKTPGGKRVEDALSAAEENLQQIAPPCLEAIDEHIANIVVMAAATPGSWNDMYEQSNKVVGLGGVFGLGDLSRAAYSLCELIDRTRDRGGPDAQALKVHINSLKLLRLGDSVPAGERQKVLDGLAAVVQRTTRESA